MDTWLSYQFILLQRQLRHQHPHQRQLQLQLHPHQLLPQRVLQSQRIPCLSCACPKRRQLQQPQQLIQLAQASQLGLRVQNSSLMNHRLLLTTHSTLVKDSLSRMDTSQMYSKAWCLTIRTTRPYSYRHWQQVARWEEGRFILARRTTTLSGTSQ